MSERLTHYVPFFTRKDAQGRQEAVCGTYVPLTQTVRVEQTPTCPGCRVWVEQVERPSRDAA